MNKLEKSIELQDRLGKELFKQNPEDFSKDQRTPKYVALGEEIAIAISGLKCEGCVSPEKLTIHHIIEKKNKHILPKNKYVVQRYSFRNIAVLCFTCHKKIHGIDYTSNYKDTSFLKHHSRPIRNAMRLLGN